MSGNERRAALQRALPFAATFLVVAIVLLVGLSRPERAVPSERSAGSPSAESPTPVSRSAQPPTREAETGGPEAGPGGPAPAPLPTTGAAAPTTRVTPEVTATQTAGKVSSRVVAWMQDLGLTGGGGSYQEAFFAELSWGRCAELLSHVDGSSADEMPTWLPLLYRTAAQACLAAFHGKTSLWSAAGAGVERLSARSSSFDCIDRAAYEVTRALVEIHRTQPDVILERGRADSARGPCPRLLSVTPSSGPAAGGYPVVITGEQLPNPAVIHFGAVTRTVATSNGRTLRFTVPPVGQYRDVGVWVEGWPYESNHSPTFTYDPPAAKESSGP
ncbi:IPT/TIG domain-containing protein [Actinoplanes sp. TRM 88003]|uniref:IPT/TIG domain-containing protein n=1 Tax=Paractinoplanes aksuensis TaxID=2939490 RepID=A0ABT1DX23_9ACTN|nr:IPT/TIG domain-containing protein [Actinoplanes aksuensis]MCO8275113.1 IPT/TIG domain-containing protein [Actinoplanes aksuensis]